MGVILKTLNFLSLIEKERIMKICKIGLCALFFGILLLGCATTKGTTPQDKRHAILDMKKDTLAELYRVKPQARSQIAKASGYAVFQRCQYQYHIRQFRWWTRCCKKQ